LRALEMDAKSQRDLLESYLAKYREAMARDTIDSAPADARVISRAMVSNVPSYPKKLPTVVIATLITLVLTAGFAVTKELLDAPTGTARLQRVPRPAKGASFGSEPRSAEASASTDLPISAIEDVAAGLRDGGAADARVAVLGIGATTGEVALKLARSLATGARVVLVGLDPADGAINAASNDPSASGLAELAASAASFRDVITRDKDSNLHLISCGRAPTDQLAILSAPGIGTSFDALAYSYDYLVVSAGAVAGAALEAIATIAPHAVLLVGMQGKAAAASARELVLGAGFDDLTVVMDARTSRVADSAVAA